VQNKLQGTSSAEAGTALRSRYFNQKKEKQDLYQCGPQLDQEESMAIGLSQFFG